MLFFASIAEFSYICPDSKWVLQCLSARLLQLLTPFMLFWWHWFSYRWSVGPTLYSCPFLGLDSCTLLFPVPENCVCCVGTLWEQGGGRDDTLSALSKDKSSFPSLMSQSSLSAQRWKLACLLEGLKAGLSVCVSAQYHKSTSCLDFWILYCLVISPCIMTTCLKSLLSWVHLHS